MFKKIITFALVLALCATMISAFALTSSAAGYDGGTGTAVDPYIISSEASIKALAEAVNGGENQWGVYFELGNDITLADNHTPIGLFDDSNAEAKIDLQFCGNFNGKGYEIKGLNIESTDVASIGLFGNLGSGAVIKNLTVSGNISATSRFVGAIAGITSNAMIYNCVSNVAIDIKGYTSLPRVGGIVGLARTMTNVDYCVNNGDIIVEPIAEASEGFVVPANLIAAGIAGELSEMCNARYCISEADVEVKNVATGYVGGIVGRATGAVLKGSAGLVTDCVVKGNLKASEGVTTGCIGGVISYLHSANYTINNCGVLGTLSSPASADGMVMTYVGFLVGNSKNAATITNNKISGDVFLGKNAGANEPVDCVAAVTELDSLEFAIKDAIAAWAKADAEAVVTTPAETTTEAPVETTVPEDETTVADETTTVADATTNVEKPADTTKKPADTTVKANESGCGGFGVAQAIAVFVSVAGVAVIIKKKN